MISPLSLVRRLIVRCCHQGAGGARRLRRAFTMAEAAVSVVLVGTLVVASLQALGAARTSRYKNAERIRARLLADGLLSEILAKSYADPSGSVTLGRDGVEITATARSTFNDVDDYDGWTEDPIQDATGSPLSGFSVWSRDVHVVWCNAASPSTASITESGVKRITVTVYHNKYPVLSAVGIKANLP